MTLRTSGTTSPTEPRTLDSRTPPVTMDYISGQCALRPVRIDLVIPPGDFDALRKGDETGSSIRRGRFRCVSWRTPGRTGAWNAPTKRGDVSQKNPTNVLSNPQIITRGQRR